MALLEIEGCTKCHICGYKHSFFPDYLDPYFELIQRRNLRLLWMDEMLSYRTRIPFESEKCENNEFDKEFDYGVQWAIKMEKLLEEDEWKKEAFKNISATTKLTQSIRGFEYLYEVYTKVVQQKKRLVAPKSWCLHSLNLELHLTKVKKLLHKKFEEVSKMLIDIEGDVEVAEEDRKNSSSTEIRTAGKIEQFINERRHTSIADIEEQGEDQCNDRKSDIGETRDSDELYEYRKSVDDEVFHVFEKCTYYTPAHAPVSQDLMLSKNKDILSTKLCRYRINLIWISCGIIILIGLIASMPREHKTTRRSSLDDDFGCLKMSDRPEELQLDLVVVVEFDYDVFTIFATDDEPLARQVCEDLEKLNLRCTAQFKHDCFRIGQNVFSNVYCNVSRSNRTLLLLTKHSLESNWVTLETILALEISNTLRLRVLLHNVAEHEIKSFKRGILASVPHISLDVKRNDWNKHLEQEINKDIHVPSLMPAGRISGKDGLDIFSLWHTSTGQIGAFYQGRGFLIHLIDGLVEGTNVFVKIINADANIDIQFQKESANFTWRDKIMHHMPCNTTGNNIISSNDISEAVFKYFDQNKKQKRAEEVFLIVTDKSVIDNEGRVKEALSKKKTFVVVCGKQTGRNVWTDLATDNNHLKELQDSPNNSFYSIKESLLKLSLKAIKCIVSLCSFIITGVPPCAVLCHWKIQNLWKIVTMICSPDCFLFMLMILKQRQKLEAYMNAVICSNKEWNYSSKRKEMVPGEIAYENLNNENSADNTEKGGFNSNKAKCNHLAVQAEQSMAFGFGVSDETNAPKCYPCEATRHLYGDCGDTFCVREKQRPSGHEQEEETQLENLVEGKDDSEESELTDSEPFKASGDDIDIHYRGMAKVYIPSKNEDIILEYSAQTRKQTDVKEYDEELKQEEDENNFDDIRQRQRTLDLPKEWMALNRHLQPSVRNLSEDTHFMTEIEKKNNGDVDVSVLIPSTPDIPHRCGASFPIDDVPTAFEANAETVQKKRKLRLQVVPNSPQQHRKQLKIKTPLRKHESKSGMMFHSDETFRNLKYKVKEDKPRQKTPDFTVKESEFDLFALRNVTWLSLNELPVPRIDITVAFVPQFDPIMVIIDQIANGTPPTPHISMRYELLRFCTLRSYPKDNKPFIIKLAEAGFYYASDGDGVVCYCCGIRRYNWVEEDIPMKIHKRVNPNCKFLKKNEEVNVPVQYYGPYGKALMAIMDIPEPVEREDRSEDVNNDWAPERVSSPAASQPNRRSESAANSLGINTATPKHTQYATKTARVGSYSGWPDTASHTPEVLADAGFFYAGFGDCVRCFYCGIGLRHWTKEDDPFVEHARWSRNCVFVKQKKGEEFVNLVQMAAQYSQENENETQSSSPAGNQLPAQEVERLLLSDAAQSVLEMGYQPRIIKRAIEQILRQNGNEKITAQTLMERVLEIEEADERAQAASAQSVEGASAQATAKPLTAKPSAAKGEGSKSDKDKANDKDKKSSNDNKDKKEDKTSSPSNGLSSEAASQDPKEIKKENEELKEQTLCKVCLDNTVCIVFLPCGHLVTCADCAPAMRKCPICRAVVKGTVRTYMS